MPLEVWLGLVEVRQLPGSNHKIELSGKGAFTWVTCWATDVESYRARVAEVMAYYGLFIVELDEVMTFAEAEGRDLMTDELLEQFEDTVTDQKFCLYGTLHSYRTDN